MSQLNFFSKKKSLYKTKEELDYLLTLPKLNVAIKIALICLGIIWLILAIFWSRLPPQIPLLYSVPWGSQQLVGKNLIWILTGFLSLTAIINLKIISFFTKKELFLSFFLAWVNTIVIIFVLITLIRIILIVT